MDLVKESYLKNVVKGSCHCPSPGQHRLVKFTPRASLQSVAALLQGLCISWRNRNASENQELVLQGRRAVASFIAVQSSCRVVCTFREGSCLALKWKDLGFWIAFSGLLIQILVLLYAGERQGEVLLARGRCLFFSPSADTERLWCGANPSLGSGTGAGSGRANRVLLTREDLALPVGIFRIANSLLFCRTNHPGSVHSSTVTAVSSCVTGNWIWHHMFPAIRQKYLSGWAFYC